MINMKLIITVISAIIVLSILSPIIGFIFQPLNPNALDNAINALGPIIILLIIIEFIRRFFR